MIGWNGNVIEDGSYIADGHVLLHEDYTCQRLLRYLRRSVWLSSVADQAMAGQAWSEAAACAALPMTWCSLEQPPIIRLFDEPTVPWDNWHVEGYQGWLRLDPDKLDLLLRATAFEDLEYCPQGSQVRAMVGSEMVGVVMPFWLSEQFKPTAKGG